MRHAQSLHTSTLAPTQRVVLSVHGHPQVPPTWHAFGGTQAGSSIQNSSGAHVLGCPLLPQSPDPPVQSGPVVPSHRHLAMPSTMLQVSAP
jgi:hypothetical protein